MGSHATGSSLQQHGTAADARRPSVAVIGAGVSGLTAAYLLTRTHDVTLFEAEHRLGGHAHTHDVTDSDGRQHAVDSGFIVHNDVTYPWLRRLFRELDIEVRPAEMSMSVRCEGCGLEYAGGRGVHGVFAQPRRLIDPRFVRMLWQVRRFHRRASAFLRTADGENLTTYGEFLEREGFSGYFVAHYAVPVVSCVWSAGRETTLAYPARYLFRFLDHHGMLRVGGSPQWYTVAGGSRDCSRTCARPMPSPTSPVARTASRSGTSPGRSPAWTASSSRPTLTRPSACSPTRATRRSPPSSSSATRATSPCCIQTARSCRTPRTPGPAGTTG